MHVKNFNIKSISFLSLIMFFLISAIIYGSPGDRVKIAIASNKKNTTSHVGAIAGRSPYYLIFDNTGKLIEIIENPYKDERKGAGLSTANFLAEKAVTLVIAETFGDKMINVMKQKGMTYLEFKGIVDDAVKKALNSK